MSVVVVGSANLDLVYRVARIPHGGETVLAQGRAQHPGGKGENQAIAAARAGAETVFVVALGADGAGDRIAATLRADRVGGVFRRVDEPTGTALITVDEGGENAIVVDPGANATLTELEPAELDVVSGADIVLLQLEIPMSAVTQTARLAHASGARVVLNAAPTRRLPTELLADLDVLIVNEHEAAELAAQLGVGAPSNTASGAAQLASALLGLVPAVVITLGSDGCVVAQRVENGTSVEHISAPAVTAVDTTGAGDTFCGALAAALDAGESLSAAARFAAAAGALAVQREGAVPAIPSRPAIVAELQRAGEP
ncbi:MAG TPA: ribokinase [Humibacter sp.]|nr:ribokinase [Humibacter sp.]